MRRSAARRTVTAALGVVLMLVLSGCFDMKGELTIDNDARISGSQRIEIQKEAGLALGISSLEFFKKMVESGGESGGLFGDMTGDDTTPDADDSCPGGFSFDETDSAYAAVCTFENFDPSSNDEMYGIKRVGDTIELTFSNDASEEDAAMMAMMGGAANLNGSVDVTFKFPGSIGEISGSTASKATKLDDRTLRIQGKLLESYDIKVVSGVSGGSAPDVGSGGTAPDLDTSTGGDDTTGSDATTGTDSGLTGDSGAATSDDTTAAAASDDGGSSAGLIIAGVLVVLVLLAIIGFLVLRGRGKSKAAAQPAFAGAPAGAAPVQGQQWDAHAQQAQVQQTQAMPTQAAPAQPAQAAPTQAVPTQQPAQQAQPGQQAAPGWYPVPGDPSGQPRYWDGTSWSDPQQQ